MTAKMTRNILLMLAATVLMGIVLNLYIHNTGTVPAADNAAPQIFIDREKMLRGHELHPIC